jgi:hypothetical protein
VEHSRSSLFLTAGAAKGSPIFLSLDLEAIEDVAARFLDEGVDGDPLLDFSKAVRRRCVSSAADRVNLDALSDYLPPSSW